MPSFFEISKLHILWIVISFAVTYPFCLAMDSKNSLIRIASFFCGGFIYLITSGLFVEEIIRKLHLGIGGKTFYLILFFGFLILIRHIAVSRKADSH